jgi:hypothetical protein
MKLIITTPSGARKPAASLHQPDHRQLDYAARRISLRARVSPAQASLIVELLGISPKVRS